MPLFGNSEFLRDDEERLRLAIAATNDKIWDLDVDSGRVRWNENFAEAFRRPLDTASSIQWWIDHIHPADRERTAGTLQAAIDSNASTWTCEYRFLRPDGTWADLLDRAYIARDASGKARRVIGAMQDLTERKRTERALRESEQMRHRILDSLRAHIAVVDRRGCITVVNQAWSRFAAENGATAMPSVTVGANYLEVCRRAAEAGDPDAQKALMGIESVLAGESSQFACVYSCHSPWEQRWFLMMVVPLQNGCLTGAVISHRDISGQKQVEEALRQSEEWLRMAQQAGHVGAFNWDILRDEAVLTPELQAIFGLKSGESENRFGEWRRHVHPEDLPQLEALFAEWMQSGRDCESWEYRFLREGEPRWLSGSGRIYRDEAGKPVRMVGTIVDITDRKRADEALRSSECRYRELVEQTADGIFVADPQGRYLDVNSAGARMLGYAATEICRMSIADVIVPEEAPRIPQEIAKLSGEEAVLSQWQFLRKDGSTFWGEVVGRRLPDGRLQGVVRDITERKQAEIALRDSEERLALALEVAQMGTFEIDLSSREVGVTPSTLHIFGYQPEPRKWVVEDLRNRVHPDDAAALDAAIELSARTGKEHTIEYRIVHPSGIVRWVVSRAAVVSGPNGRPRRLLGAVVDITTRKQMEMQLADSLLQLREAQQELMRQERLATLGKLAGSVAHEIRSPLTVIQNNIYFLEQRFPPESQEVCESLAEVRRAIGNSNHIITEMLDYVREPPAKEAAFDVNEAISDALHFVPLPEEIRLRTAGRGSARRRMVRANRDQVTRILVNLIQNAVQAMPHGGELEFCTESEEPSRTCVAVRDTGCGIPAENLGKIFEPLFSTRTTGIGLGLAIAKRYAELNRGSLSVESQPGCGAKFRLTLESAHPVSRKRGKPKGKNAHSAQRKTRQIQTPDARSRPSPRTAPRRSSGKKSGA